MPQHDFSSNTFISNTDETRIMGRVDDEATTVSDRPPRVIELPNGMGAAVPAPSPAPDPRRVRRDHRRTAVTALVAIATSVVLVSGAAALGIVVLRGI